DHRLFGNQYALAFGLFLGDQFGDRLVDLGHAILVTLHDLRQLEYLQLHRMRALLPRFELATRFVDLRPRRFQPLVDLGDPRFLRFECQLPLADDAVERLDLALTFEEAVLGGVRSEQRDAVAADEIATAGHP